MKIVFMGTPKFGAIILEKLIEGGYKPDLVITETDKEKGRKQILTSSSVKVTAQNFNIPIFQPEKNEDLKSKIESMKPDLAIVAAYGRILSKEVLDIPKYKSLNIHPSILPKYRGASPIQHTILNDDKESGVTIILMDEKIDHGKIISRINCQIPEKITYRQLSLLMAELGGKIIVDTIPKWINNEIEPEIQKEVEASYTKTLKKEDGKIDWNLPATQIEKKIRAFDPWPGTWTSWNNIRLKILKTRVFKFPVKEKYLIGQILIVPQNEAAVQCKEDFLVLEELQLEGKKPLKSEEFLRGHQDFMNAVLK